MEAFLLLIGVLLALLGQTWWESREERQTVREYAANLGVEVSVNQEQLQKAIMQHDSYINTGSALIQDMQLPPESGLLLSTRKYLAKLGYIPDFRPATSSLENLVVRRISAELDAKAYAERLLKATEVLESLLLAEEF